MKRLLLSLATLLAGLIALVVWALWLDPRPEDTTEARVYEDDAARVNYCELPELDGSGQTAAQIPKAFTPGCDTDQWPAPILAACTEPLAPDAADLRGLWQSEAGGVPHIERIEQCGDRVVISAPRFIHDFRTTGRLADGADDITPGRCTRVRAAMRWQGDTLTFRPWNTVVLVTRRLEDDDTLLWDYPGRGLSRLKRLCRLPVSE